VYVPDFYTQILGTGRHNLRLQSVESELSDALPVSETCVLKNPLRSNAPEHVNFSILSAAEKNRMFEFAGSASFDYLLFRVEGM
jgi:hypothetical protein